MRSGFLLGAVLMLSQVAAPAYAGNPIQPGAGIESKAGACTANFIFDGTGPMYGRVFVGTAAHCVPQEVGAPVTDAPERTGPLVFGEGEQIGTVVALGDGDAESIVDWALIEVLPSRIPDVTPALKGHPDLPRGTEIRSRGDLARGDLLQFSGYAQGFDISGPTREQRVGLLDELAGERADPAARAGELRRLRRSDRAPGVRSPSEPARTFCRRRDGADRRPDRRCEGGWLPRRDPHPRQPTGPRAAGEDVSGARGRPGSRSGAAGAGAPADRPQGQGCGALVPAASPPRHQRIEAGLSRSERPSAALQLPPAARPRSARRPRDGGRDARAARPVTKGHPHAIQALPHCPTGADPSGGSRTGGNPNPAGRRDRVETGGCTANFIFDGTGPITGASSWEPRRTVCRESAHPSRRAERLGLIDLEEAEQIGTVVAMGDGDPRLDPRLGAHRGAAVAHPRRDARAQGSPAISRAAPRSARRGTWCAAPPPFLGLRIRFRHQWPDAGATRRRVRRLAGGRTDQPARSQCFLRPFLDRDKS